MFFLSSYVPCEKSSPDFVSVAYILKYPGSLITPLLYSAFVTVSSEGFFGIFTFTTAESVRSIASRSFKPVTTNTPIAEPTISTEAIHIQRNSLLLRLLRLLSSLFSAFFFFLSERLLSFAICSFTSCPLYEVISSAGGWLELSD